MPPAKQILCLYLLHWSIARRYRQSPDLRGRSVAVIRTAAQRREVVDASPLAQKSGIRCGLSAAEAGALCRNLICIEQDTTGDHRALDALGRWLNRFTPIVARGWDENDESPSPEFALFLDLTGCERLFGGIRRLVGLIQQSLVRFQIPAKLAVAPTPGAAWALALTAGRTSAMCDGSSLRPAILPLSVTTLRLDSATVDNLHQLGLQTVGDVLALPRDHLPSRFGPLLLKRLDQLTGVLVEPLTKLVIDLPVVASVEFDSPVDSLEDTWLIFENLLVTVLTDLTRRNHGVRRLRMTFKPDRGWGLPTIKRTITLARPHRHQATLLDLIRCETEKVDLYHGFVKFRLEVTSHEAISDTQTQLFEQKLVQEQMELDRLLQRLRARLTEAAVIRPQLVESYLPECAWRPAEDEPTVAMLTYAPPRPLTVFPTPIEIRVICEPSDDRTGQPRQFTWQGQVHRLTHIVGPERIAGEWWRGHTHTRDYYETEDEAGQRFWLFRVIHVWSEEKIAARWFLHGRFD